MNYQIASKSEKGRKKESFECNGDCCGWIEESGCVVLALADGVGSCADDARASRTVCDLFMEKCRMALKGSKVLTEERLMQFCREIDPVLAVDNDMACFCAVVWYANTRSVTWLHVGDTRSYRYSKAEGFVQMTQDDHGKAVNIKVNGKLYTDHGAVVSATPINNAIGDRGCDFHIGSFEFNPGESVILCSDGMYNSSSFNDDMESLLNQADLTDSIKSLTTTDDDDYTLLVLRCDMTVDTGLDELMEQFEQDLPPIPRPALIDSFCDGLEKKLEDNADANDIAKLAAFMKIHQIYPDRQRIDKLFNDTFNKLKATPQGEDWQQLNAACLDLKDILRYVFTH